MTGRCLFLTTGKMELPLTGLVNTADGADLGGYEELRSGLVKFEKPFRHPNVDMT